MQRQTAQQGQGLAGTERYGTVHNAEVRQLIPAHIQPGVEPASPSGTRYGILSQCIFVRKDGEQCRAPQKKGSDFCVGHTRQLAKVIREQEEAEKKEAPSVEQE